LNSIFPIVQSAVRLLLLLHVEPKDAKEGSMKLMGLLRLSDNGCVEKYRRTLFQHTLFFDHQVLYVQCCHLSL